MDISRNNYETYFLLYLDEELSAAERSKVENFLVENADLQKEFSLLQNTIQKPEEIIFGQKDLLYREEGKRRVIPVYWTRIAAALLLTLAGSWFLTTIFKNHHTSNSIKEQPVAAVGAKKNQPPAHEATNLNQLKQVQIPDRDASNLQKTQKNNKTNPDVSGQRTQEPAENAVTKKSSEPVKRDSRRLQNPVIPVQQMQDSPDDPVMVMQKSSATSELQSGGNHYTAVSPGQTPAVVTTPLLMIETAGKNDIASNANEQTADITTDNAISVIALNDRNKAITGFFKKLTKRTSGDETAGNTKKLRVSVFQFSY